MQLGSEAETVFQNLDPLDIEGAGHQLTSQEHEDQGSMWDIFSLDVHQT